MKRKLSAVLFSVSVLACLAMPVSAANETSKSTQLKYESAGTWTVSIPRIIDFSDGEAKEAQISAVTNLVPETALRVRVSEGLTDSKVTLAREKDTGTTIQSLASTDASGTALIKSDTVVASFEGLHVEEVLGGTLYFAPLTGTIKAGTYTGNITFSIGAEPTGAQTPETQAQ